MTTSSSSGTGPIGRGRGVLVGLLLFSSVVLASATVVTATHEPIRYGTNSGLNVTDASGGSLPNGTPFPDDETVALPGINVSAAGGAAVTIETRTGTTTDLSGIDARHPITVTPDDKQAVVLLAGLDTLNLSAADYTASTTDLTYTASGQARLRLTATGLTTDTEIEAVDTATDTRLDRATVAANGSVTFTALPTGSYDVTLRETDGEDSPDDSSPSDDGGSGGGGEGGGQGDGDGSLFRTTGAVIFADSQFITPGTTVRFDGRRSRPAGEITSYSWDFDGDGTIDATGPEVSRTFVVPGRYPVTLSVRSAQSVADGTDTLTVRVRNATPTPPRQATTTEPRQPNATEPRRADASNRTEASSGPWLVPSVRDLHFGGATDRLAVRISNPLGSDREIRLREIEVVGRDSSRFSVVSGGRGSSTLAPGQSQRIELRASAGGGEPQHAQLRIHSDAANPRLDIWLTTSPTVVLVEEREPETANASVSVQARNVDRNSRLSVDVSPSRPTAAAVERLDMVVRPAADFEMDLTHAEEPHTLGAEPFDPPDRTVLQYIRLTHTLPNEEFDETAVVYRVRKDALPPGTMPVEVVFRRYEDGEWTELVSSLDEETDRHYVYRVETDGFSQFLVSGPTDARSVASTDSDSETVSYLLAGLLVAGTIGSGILVLRSRRDRSGDDILK